MEKSVCIPKDSNVELLSSISPMRHYLNTEDTHFYSNTQHEENFLANTAYQL